MSKKTVELIISSGNDYFIAVKANQKSLHETIRSVVNQDQPISTFIKNEKNRGRFEHRYTAIFDNIEQIDKDWIGLKRIVHNVNAGIRENKFYHEEHFYICSLETNDAQLIATGRRGHWGIENSLHYVKDVVLNEDKNGIRNMKDAALMAQLNNIAVSIYRINGFKSIKNAKILFANKINELFAFFKSNT